MIRVYIYRSTWRNIPDNFKYQAIDRAKKTHMKDVSD
jgi:hypothetical protein